MNGSFSTAPNVEDQCLLLLVQKTQSFKLLTPVQYPGASISMITKVLFKLIINFCYRHLNFSWQIVDIFKSH